MIVIPFLELQKNENEIDVKQAVAAIVFYFIANCQANLDNVEWSVAVGNTKNDVLLSGNIMHAYLK